MSHHPPVRTTLPSAPSAISTAGPPRLSRAMIHAGISLRQAALDALEAELVSDCEAAAGLGNPELSAVDNRASWDRAAWGRYLAAAVQVEARYGPRMRRLHADIEHLERLLHLPIAFDTADAPRTRTGARASC